MDTEMGLRLGSLMEELSKGVGFAKEQAPVIVEQLLKYETLKACIGLVIGGILLALFIFSTYKVVAAHKRNNFDAEHYIYISLFSGVVSVAVTLLNTVELIKLHIAPNLYVLDYIKGAV